MAADDLEILRCLAASFRQDKYCDVAFRCHDGVVLRANRAFLSARSDFFDKMLYSSMREGSSNEVNLPYVSSAAFRIILDYLYTGALHAPTEPLPASAAAALHLQQLRQSRHQHAQLHASPTLPPLTTQPSISNTQQLASYGTHAAIAASAVPCQLTTQDSTLPTSSAAVNRNLSAALLSGNAAPGASSSGLAIIPKQTMYKPNATVASMHTSAASAAAAPGCAIVGVVSHGPGGQPSLQRKNDACLVEAYATAQQYFLTSLQKQLLLHMEALLSTGPQDRIGYMMSLSLDHGLEPLTSLAIAKWTAAQNPYSVCFTDAFSGAAVCACVTEAAVWAPSQVLLQAAARWAQDRAALHIPPQRTYLLDMLASQCCDDVFSDSVLHKDGMEAAAAVLAPFTAGKPHTPNRGDQWGLGSPCLSPLGRSAVQGGAEMMRKFGAGMQAAGNMLEQDQEEAGPVMLDVESPSSEISGQRGRSKETQQEATGAGWTGSKYVALLDVASGSIKARQPDNNKQAGGGACRSGGSIGGSGSGGTSGMTQLPVIAVESITSRSNKAGCNSVVAVPSVSTIQAGMRLGAVGGEPVSSPTSSTSSSQNIFQPSPAINSSSAYITSTRSDMPAPHSLAVPSVMPVQHTSSNYSMNDATMPRHGAVSFAATAAHERDIESAVRELLLPIVSSMDLRTVGVAVIEGIVERYCLLPLPQLLRLYKWQLSNGLLIPRQSGSGTSALAAPSFGAGVTAAAGQDALPHSASSPVLLGVGLGGSGINRGAGTTSAASAADPSVLLGRAGVLESTRAESVEPQQQRLAYAAYASPPRLRNQPPTHAGPANQQPATVMNLRALAHGSEILGQASYLPPVTGQQTQHSSRYHFASDGPGSSDIHSPWKAGYFSGGAKGAAGAGDGILVNDAEATAAAAAAALLPFPVQHPLLLPVLGSRMVSKAGPGGLSVVITNQSSPHQAARSEHPLNSGRHTFNFKVLTYSTFIWLGVVQEGCGVDSWPGTGPHGWLYGSNDALVNNHTDRYERFLGAGEWQGIGHTVTMVVDMELRQVWFGPNSSELRLGFSHLPAHVYPAVSLQAGAAVEAWYC